MEVFVTGAVAACRLGVGDPVVVADRGGFFREVLERGWYPRLDVDLPAPVFWL